MKVLYKYERLINLLIQWNVKLSEVNGELLQVGAIDLEPGMLECIYGRYSWDGILLEHFID